MCKEKELTLLIFLQCHLLEHAMDSILEAGEVPWISLFMEMICQSISQQNFERTVDLINGMAHASMQVSESRWTSIFNWNSDRLDKEKFHNLMNHLDNGNNLVTDDPVPSFIRSVKSFGQSNDTLALAASRNYSEEDSIFHSSVEGEKHGERILCHLPGKRPTADSYDELQNTGDSATSTRANPFDNLSKSQIMGAQLEELIDFDAVSRSVAENEGKMSDITREADSDSSSSDSSFDLSNDRADSPFTELPSAVDILDTWKKDRIKDGRFPFEYVNSSSQ